MSAATPHSTTLPLCTRATNDSTALAETAAGPRSARTPCGCVDSTDILRGQKTVAISHNGSTYRLQATRLGKLILTK